MPSDPSNRPDPSDPFTRPDTPPEAEPFGETVVARVLPESDSSDSGPSGPDSLDSNPLGPDPNAPVVWRFEFRGTAAEFFRIWLVNTLLTLATFGIFSAWAKVRTRRYFHGSAFLNGANFDYLASPWSILIARIVIVLVVVGGASVAGEDLLENAVHTTLLALLLPWALVRGLAFNARYSSHRGARFAFQKQTAAAYLLFSPLLALLVLPGYAAYFAAENASLSDLGAGGEFAASSAGLIVALLLVLVGSAPWLLRAWHDLKARNHSLGPVRFRFQKPPVRSYWAALWGIPLLGIVVLVAVVIPQFSLATEENIFTRGPIAIITAYAMMLFVFTFVNAKFFHLFWNHLRFSIGDESGRFRADFSLWEFAVKILTVNYIVTIVSFGLMYPWAKIRRARFIAERMTLETTEAALDKIPGLRRRDESAFGEEFDALEGFDFDVGLV